MTSWLRAQGAGVAITVHVQPGASRCELAGEHGEALKVRISARAVEGSANAALREFIAECLGVARREVSRGLTEKCHLGRVFTKMYS